MHCHCIDTLSRELVLLVLHQGDERAHHDRKARHQESRKLIDDRLATARRHYDECITTFEKSFNGRPLSSPKIGMTEPLREDKPRGCAGKNFLHIRILLAGTIPRRSLVANVYSPTSPIRDYGAIYGVK